MQHTDAFTIMRNGAANENLYCAMRDWRSRMEAREPFAHFAFHKLLEDLWALDIASRSKMIASCSHPEHKDN